MLDFAQSENMELIGEIPYDEGVMQALRQAKPLTRSASPAIQSALEAIWQQLKERIA
jgi:MinD superfamily P-loop ATPase